MNLDDITQNLHHSLTINQPTMSPPFTTNNYNQDESTDWRYTLICRTVIETGENANNNYMAIRSVLKRSSVMEIHMITPNMFLLRFSSLDSMNVVLRKGPWSIYGQLLLMKRYYNNIPPQQTIFDSFEIWLHFIDLPHMKRSENGIFKLLQGIVPITEFHPKNKNDQPPPEGRSVKVIFQLDQPLLKGILTDDTFGNKIWVEFAYHNLPTEFCDQCRLMGHTSVRCHERQQQDSSLILNHTPPPPPPPPTTQLPQTYREERGMETTTRATTFQTTRIRREQVQSEVITGNRMESQHFEYGSGSRNQPAPPSPPTPPPPPPQHMHHRSTPEVGPTITSNPPQPTQHNPRLTTPFQPRLSTDQPPHPTLPISPRLSTQHQPQPFPSTATHSQLPPTTSRPTIQSPQTILLNHTPEPPPQPNNPQNHIPNPDPHLEPLNSAGPSTQSIPSTQHLSPTSVLNLIRPATAHHHPQVGAKRPATAVTSPNRNIRFRSSYSPFNLQSNNPFSQNNFLNPSLTSNNEIIPPLQPQFNLADSLNPIGTALGFSPHPQNLFNNLSAMEIGNPPVIDIEAPEPYIPGIGTSHFVPFDPYLPLSEESSSPQVVPVLIEDDIEEEHSLDDSMNEFAEQIEDELTEHDQNRVPELLFPHQLAEQNQNHVRRGYLGLGRRGTLAFRRVRNQRIREETIDEYGQSLSNTTTESSTATQVQTFHQPPPRRTGRPEEFRRYWGGH